MHNSEHPVGLYHHLVRQLHRLQPQCSPEVGAVCTTHQREQTTCPPGHLQHPMSQKGQNKTTTRATTFSPRSHPEGEVSTGASKLEPRDWKTASLSLGHQNVKLPSLAQRLLPPYRLEIIGQFSKWNTSHFNNATLIMFTYHCITHLMYTSVFYTLNCILAYATLSLLIHIYIFLLNSFT
jgi:hypothetical protein